jgi:acetoacetyl-CoA synthetase
MPSADPHTASPADPGADARQPLWRPPPEQLHEVEMARFMRWAGERRGAPFADYDELWRWSVDELEQFWA